MTANEVVVLMIIVALVHSVVDCIKALVEARRQQYTTQQSTTLINDVSP